MAPGVAVTILTAVKAAALPPLLGLPPGVVDNAPLSHRPGCPALRPAGARRHQHRRQVTRVRDASLRL